MPTQLIRAMVDDATRGDDRAPGTAKPPVLTRRTTRLLAVLGLAAIAYVTLFPFEYDLSRGVSWRLPWHAPVAGDAMANVLAYIPLGACLRLVLRRRGSYRVVEWGLSLLLVAGLSYLSEVAQSVIPARVPSAGDTLCNVFGGILGIAIGPWLQRSLRNLHAWLFNLLRTRPFEAAAMVAILALATHALMPFDLHPSPGHIQRSLAALNESFTNLGTLSIYPALSSTQKVGKIAAAGAYALPAFLMVLAAMEAGRTLRFAAWRGLSRCGLLALAMETAQFFTVSHVADPADLLAAWLFAGVGTGVACLLCMVSPQSSRRPLVVLRGLVLMGAAGLALWGSAVLVFSSPRIAAPMRSCWLPLAGNFDRSWNGVLGDYTTGFFQYLMVSALILLWYRSRRIPPSTIIVFCLTVMTALLVGMVQVMLGRALMDTAVVLLASLAAAIAIRLDQAICSRHAGKVTSQL
ncbi:MAG: VanZ family protein [Phycisphaerales bacterium]|nr:VanZ family protein [Phycisphaerales bacterium]